MKVYLLGMIEFRSDYTSAMPDSASQETYDAGRDMAHFLTFRYWDQSC